MFVQYTTYHNQWWGVSILGTLYPTHLTTASKPYCITTKVARQYITQVVNFTKHSTHSTSMFACMSSTTAATEGQLPSRVSTYFSSFSSLDSFLPEAESFNSFRTSLDTAASRLIAILKNHINFSTHKLKSILVNTCTACKWMTLWVLQMRRSGDDS